MTIETRRGTSDEWHASRSPSITRPNGRRHLSRADSARFGRSGLATERLSSDARLHRDLGRGGALDRPQVDLDPLAGRSRVRLLPYDARAFNFSRVRARDYEAETNRYVSLATRSIAIALSPYPTIRRTYGWSSASPVSVSPAPAHPATG